MCRHNPDDGVKYCSKCGEKNSRYYGTDRPADPAKAAAKALRE